MCKESVIVRESAVVALAGPLTSSILRCARIECIPDISTVEYTAALVADRVVVEQIQAAIDERSLTFAMVRLKAYFWGRYQLSLTYRIRRGRLYFTLIKRERTK